MYHYLIPSNYAQWARKNLLACNMGNHNITKYIDAFWEYLVCYSDIHKAKAKFFFKNNIADWLDAYILPYNNKIVTDAILYSERIGGIQRIHGTK